METGLQIMKLLLSLSILIIHNSTSGINRIFVTSQLTFYSLMIQFPLNNLDIPCGFFLLNVLSKKDASPALWRKHLSIAYSFHDIGFPDSNRSPWMYFYDRLRYFGQGYQLNF